MTSVVCSLKCLLFHRIEYPKRYLWKKNWNLCMAQFLCWNHVKHRQFFFTIRRKWNGKLLFSKNINKNDARHTSLFTKEVHLTCRVYELAVWPRRLTAHIVRGRIAYSNSHCVSNQERRYNHLVITQGVRNKPNFWRKSLTCLSHQFWLGNHDIY